MKLSCHLGRGSFIGEKQFHIFSVMLNALPSRNDSGGHCRKFLEDIKHAQIHRIGIEWLCRHLSSVAISAIPYVKKWALDPFPKKGTLENGKSNAFPLSEHPSTLPRWKWWKSMTLIFKEQTNTYGGVMTPSVGLLRVYPKNDCIFVYGYNIV